MKPHSVCLALTLIVALVAPAQADMGRVHVSASGVIVEETAQKAIILQNGAQEALILGTEIRATAKTPIIRFIPFPTEPHAALAPVHAFDALATILGKYKLQFQERWQSKGRGGGTTTQGVEVRMEQKLGSHDLTILRVDDASKFRAWVNAYFVKNGLPHADSYPVEESIVADYVKRGYPFFALDRVDAPTQAKFIEPITYQFASSQLYYPLLTSNSFGGKGTIELFIVAPVTLCRPGSNVTFGGHDRDGDLAVTAPGAPRRKCFDITVKASTSAQLPPQESDLAAIYPEWKAFFGTSPMFVQAIRYDGPYAFDHDVLTPLEGEAKALSASAEAENGPHLSLGDLVANPNCQQKPEHGPCKGIFERFYFDPMSNSCKAFDWGGCQGVAPFETLETCNSVCK